ncbi:hypothetical protein PV735_45645 [Streptomyces turgidiscabies]|uniref:hypothetical protein n=1 Tax=Streptomyces TaxID=1883 RepID=UPI0005C951C0|nr:MULTISPECIES: hypothetical protein [Streptomyces]MDX3499910.1 hypothetical protein [Streptomyces turgidiscabies]GAQ76949.1 hypothetical protein T45_08761 [Streptomyces turgidiscabies]
MTTAPASRRSRAALHDRDQGKQSEGHPIGRGGSVQPEEGRDRGRRAQRESAEGDPRPGGESLDRTR